MSFLVQPVNVDCRFLCNRLMQIVVPCAVVECRLSFLVQSFNVDCRSF